MVGFLILELCQIMTLLDSLTMIIQLTICWGIELKYKDPLKALEC